jgi:hypothetical protein
MTRPACVGAPTPSSRRGGVLASAVSAAGSWLLEPADPAFEELTPGLATPRPVVAVFGLGRGCGATVVARALAAELATRDPAGTAAVACEARAAGVPLATRAASRLARALGAAPGVATRAVGRLCLVESPDQLALADTSRLLAPLVLDAGSTSLGGAPASLADRTVLVATSAVEPALTQVAAECLLRMGVEPLVTVNRVRGTEAPEGPEPSAEPRHPPGCPGAPLHLPEARLGAQLALGGREARGELGRAIAELADRCEGDAS